MQMYYQPEGGGPRKALWLKLGAVDEVPIKVEANTAA